MPVRRDARYALILIGMQNELLHPDGFFHRKGFVGLEAEERAGLIRNVTQLAAKMRQAERPVIHAHWSFRADYLDSSFSQQWRRRGLQENLVFVKNSFGAAFVEGLDVAPDDFLLPLRSHSAFQFTHLDRTLRNCGVETCILAGGTASGGIDDTARQGAALGYRMLLVPDAIYPLGSSHLQTLVTRADRIQTGDLLELIGRETLAVAATA